MTRFRVIIKSQKSNSTYCPFLDKLCIYDALTDKIVWSSQPYSLDDRDGELCTLHLIEKQKMNSWFAENYPLEDLDR